MADEPVPPSTGSAAAAAATAGISTGDAPAVTATLSPPTPPPPADDEDFSVWVHLFAGSVGGMMQTVVGHPFDTVKVRLQVQTDGHYRSVLHAARLILKEEGMLGFYKGMASPFVGMTALNTVLFGSYGQASDWLEQWNAKNTPGETDLSLLQMTLAGTFAGFAQSYIIGPTELIRNKLQIQREAKGRAAYKGPIDVIQKIVRDKGVPGLFKSMSATLFREIPAYAVCFYVYEGARILMTPEGGDPDEIGAVKTMLAGGLGGMACWTASYPQDVVKNVLQVEPSSSTRFPKHPWLFDGGYLACQRYIYETHGMRGFWVGYSACLIRAFPANAASFFGVATVLKTVRKFRRGDYDDE